MAQATANITIGLNDGQSGNTPATKVVSGIACSGTLNDYIQPQQIGLPAPVNLGASLPAGSGNLTSGTYYYKVTALNGTGETTPSQEVSVIVFNGLVQLSWPALPGATSYRIYRGTISNGQSVYYTSPTSSYLDTGAWGTSGSVPGSNTTQVSAPGTVTPTGSTTGGTLAAATYYYKVTALNAVGETTGSSEANVTTTGSTSSVALAWAAVAGASSYRIYRGTSASGENVYYTSSVNSFTDTNATSTSGSVPGSNTTQVSAPGTITPAVSAVGGFLPAGTYFYKITAVNAVGETTPSSEASATTVGNTSSILLTWATVPGAVSYSIYRGTTTGSENKVISVSTNSYLDTTVPSTSGSAPTSNGTGSTWSPTLPISPIQFLYVRNLSPINTLTISATPTGGSSQTLAVLAPYPLGALLVTGGGYTAVSGSASAPGTPVEAIFNG
jgi:hypothetical protein